MLKNSLGYHFSTNISIEEYNKFVENHSMCSFMQEFNWSNIKNQWSSIHCGLYKSNKLIAVCLILIRKEFNLKIFYIPRGYLIDFTNYEDLKIMTENIKKLAKKEHALLVKIDPNFCISDNSFKDEDVEHNYSKDYKIKNDNLIKLGYKNKGIQKKIGKNFQPQYNVFAPLVDKNNNLLCIEDILKTYKSKFKYYLNDFHKKRGITFEITNNLDSINDFVNLIKLTEQRQNIHLRNREYFERILNNFKDRAFIFFAKIDLKKYLEFLQAENSDEINDIEELIKEGKDIIIISTGLLLLPANKVGIRTSEYLYAGNDMRFNKLNASAGLVYEMIKFSLDHQCHYCNLGGVSGTLDDNLTIFKRKFNGRIMLFCGEYNLPISWKYYVVKFLYPIAMKFFKLFKK